MKRLYYKIRDKEWPLKLKMLWLYHGAFRNWYSDVWQQEPHISMCCSGIDCGCRGSCYAEWWEHHWNNRKATL